MIKLIGERSIFLFSGRVPIDEVIRNFIQAIANKGTLNEITANVTVVNTSNISNLAIFKVEDDWEIFSERLDQFFLANRVEDGRKVSVLLTSISEEVYIILRNVCHTDKRS